MARSHRVEQPFEKHMIIIIGHDISSNALGRALALADAAALVTQVKVMAFGRGPIWSGSSQFSCTPQRLGQDWREQLSSAIGGEDTSAVSLWLIKGMAPLQKVAQHAKQTNPDVKIVLDVDDDDVGLARSFRALRFLNRVKLHAGRRGHPSSIKRCQERVAALSDGATFSTNALATLHTHWHMPTQRIIHPRGAASREERLRPTACVSIGLFGTIRPHKGGDLLVEILRRNEGYKATVFAGSGLIYGDSVAQQITEIPATTPLAEAYAMVNVTLLAQRDEPGSRHQLPAKLLDALNAGVAIVATPTPAVNEIASDLYLPIRPGSTPDDVAHLLSTAPQSTDHRAAWQRFDTQYSSSVTSRSIRSFFNYLHVDGRPS